MQNEEGGGRHNEGLRRTKEESRCGWMVLWEGGGGGGVRGREADCRGSRLQCLLSEAERLVAWHSRSDGGLRRTVSTLTKSQGASTGPTPSGVTAVTRWLIA